MRISVSNLSKYGPCSKAIDESLYNQNGTKKVGYPKQMETTEPSKLGTALHKIVQSVLSTKAEHRIAKKHEMLKILSEMRNNCVIPNELEDLLGSEFLRGSYESKMVQDLANNGITLLHNSFDLLAHLETSYPGSKSKWVIEIEHCLHDKENNGPYLHTIFTTDTELRAYVDLKLTWDNLVVLGELKSGNITQEKQVIWSRQISAYTDIWNRLNPNIKSRGFIINGSIYLGFCEVDIKLSPLGFNHNNPELRVFNEGCSQCDLRRRCPEYND